MKREVERLGVRVAVMKAARANSEGDVTTLTRVLHKTAWDRAALEKDKMLQVRLMLFQRCIQLYTDNVLSQENNAT